MEPQNFSQIASIVVFAPVMLLHYIVLKENITYFRKNYFALLVENVLALGIYIVFVHLLAEKLSKPGL